jgi:hypothetical protein
MAVIQFPDRRERVWRVVETAVRGQVREAGAGDAAADWILNDLRPRFEAFHGGALDIEVPTEAAARVTEIVRFMHDRMSAGLFEMIRLEVELYGAKFLSLTP